MSLADFFNSDLRAAQRWDAQDSKQGRPTTKDANARLMQAYKSRGLKMAAQALAAGACADLTTETGRYHGGYGYGTTIYMTPMLVQAAQSGMHEFAKLLLQYGAKPEAYENRRYWCAMHYAADNGDTPMVRLLLDAGADPAPNGQGSTPYQLAREKQYTDIVAMVEAEPARREAAKQAARAEALRRARDAAERIKEAERQDAQAAIAVATKAPSVTQTGQAIKVMEPLKIKKNVP